MRIQEMFRGQDCGLGVRPQLGLPDGHVSVLRLNMQGVNRCGRWSLVMCASRVFSPCAFGHWACRAGPGTGSQLSPPSHFFSFLLFIACNFPALASASTLSLHLLFKERLV